MRGEWPWVRKMRQPWLFVYYAVGFGGLTYLFQRLGLFWAIWEGLAFAVLASLWREVRGRAGSRTSG
jgi:hypothetical protein